MATYFVLAWMHEKGVPLTSKEYQRIMYIMGAPVNEIEASIPQPIRDAEDVAWMSELGVQWSPENEDDNED